MSVVEYFRGGRRLFVHAVEAVDGQLEQSCAGLPGQRCVQRLIATAADIEDDHLVAEHHLQLHHLVGQTRLDERVTALRFALFPNNTPACTMI